MVPRLRDPPWPGNCLCPAGALASAATLELARRQTPAPAREQAGPEAAGDPAPTVAKS
jgi:hypothetical protein